MLPSLKKLTELFNPPYMQTEVKYSLNGSITNMFLLFKIK